MSRYVTMKTQLRDMELLRQTLQSMGCAIEENPGTRLLMPGGRKPELIAQTPGGRLGFVPMGEEPIAVVGMEETLKRDSCRQFLGAVTQQYARRKVMAEAERAGYRLVEETVDADNTIRLVVRKW